MTGLLFGLGHWALAQSNVSGVVKDDLTGVGIPGVYVTVKNTDAGTATDLDGKFSISASSSDTLVFSFLGYMTQEVAVGDQTTFEIMLAENQEQLEEVLVVGYGEQKKSVATGSIGQVGAKDIEGYNVQNPVQAIQGTMSGVQVSPASGSPGAGLNIVIRGVGTNGNSSPLYVVDGMVVDNIDFINPQDIESMNVLKDAASSAIYGARGANGVVIVTTKKGAKGEGSMTYNGFYGISTPWRVPKLMGATDYVAAINEKFANAGQVPLASFPAVGDELTTDTDWLGEILSPAAQQNHQISVSRGGDKGSVYFSFGYYDQEGIVAGGDKSNFQKWTGRLNTETQVNDYVKVGQNLSFTHWERSTVPENNSFGSTISNAIALDPITSVYDTAGEFGFGQSNFVGKEYINPVSQIHITNNREKVDELLGNAYVEVTPIEGLKVRSDFGLRYRFQSQWSYAPAHDLTPTVFNDLNDVFQGNFKSPRWQWENFVTYDKTIDKHHLNVVAGTSARRETGEFSGASSQAIPEDLAVNPNFRFLEAGTDSLDAAYGGQTVEYALNSYFFRAIYDYDAKYLFTFTLRNDRSSRFGSNFRNGNFPSVSLGWVVSEEDFWPLEFMNFLKVRGSWGINGNDRIGELEYEALITTADRSYFFGGTPYIGASPSRLSNPNLKWEESEQLDLGIETQFFRGSVTLDVTYYSKLTNDLLILDNSFADLYGIDAPRINAGAVRNRGWEVNVGYKKIVSRSFDFGVNFNLTTVDNEVTRVPSATGFEDGYTWPVRNLAITRMEEGHPIGYFRGYKTLGIFQTQDEVFAHINSNGDLLQPDARPGDLKFADLDGDGEIGTGDITNIGQPWPSLILGLNLTANYKGFDIRALFAASIGHDIYRTFERQDVPYNNYTEEWLDRWTPENTGAEYPRLVAGDPNGNQRPSDFYVEDGDFLRIKNLQIGYTLPRKLSEKALIQRARVYLSFDNILTITGYSGFDPEIGNSGWILQTGIDQGFYMAPRTVGGGMTLSF